MEQQPKVIKKPAPYRPIKYFVSSLNTFFGHQLVNQLRNDNLHPQNPHRIVGTLSQKQNLPVPTGVRKVIDKTKVKFTQDILLDSDVIIYDLNTCDMQEAQFAISTLKVAKNQQCKILICVSNVMTWALTPPKQKKQEQGDDIDDGAGEEPDSQQQGKEIQQNKKTYVRFTDKDYTLRRPLPQYQKLKSIETLCLAAGNVRKQLISYVLCSGILYGNGQRILQPYFQQARLQKPQQLVYYGQGKNRIPMVHVKDLVTYVKKVVQRPPNVHYLLAIDHNPKPTLKKIVQSISIGIGTGKVKKVNVDKTIPNINILTLNLRLKPSNCFIKLEQQQAAIEQEEGNQIPKFKFDWECKQGVQKNIKKLCDQYNTTRGYKQIKILISGPPASGKTYYAKRLAQKYYLPHLHIKQIIEQVKVLQNNPLAEQVNTFLTSQKQRLIEEGNTAFQQRKQKWKKIPKDQRQPLQPFKPQKVVPILSDQLVYKVFEWRLNQNDCLNRGYILDGYPRTYQNAKNIFMTAPVQQQGADQNTVKIINHKALPSKVFILQATDQQLLNNLKNLPQQLLQGSHFNETDMKRRLKIYRKRNEPNTGLEVVQDFFTQNNVEVYHLKLSNHLQKNLQSIINPLSPEESTNQQLALTIIKTNKAQIELNKKKNNERQILSRDIQLQDYKIKKQNQQNQEREILERNSLALRKYLDANVVPFLVEGIHVILKQLPENPVDHLAEFLFKMSLKVPNPDPSTFEF